jgi:hypothetical protein
MGRNYPQGYEYDRTRLHKAFISQKDEADEDKIREGIRRAEFVRKGMCMALDDFEGIVLMRRCRN